MYKEHPTNWLARLGGKVEQPGGEADPTCISRPAMRPEFPVLRVPLKTAVSVSPVQIPSDKAPVRILAVWTREIDATDHVGRVKTARQIRDALQGSAPVTARRLTNAFEEPRPIRALVSSLIALLAGLLSGRPLPLQCAIFAAAARRPALLADGLDADVVYLDGIRTLLWLRRLRRLAPRLRIVVDFDDLMSRRYEHLSRRDLPFSFGYLERMLPRPIVTLTKNISRAVLWYERIALRSAEKEVLRLADAVVLVNRSEADMLRQGGANARRPPRATIAVVPPTAKPIDYDMQSTCSNPPNGWHAIFVGSDMLVQNRMAIAYLLDLWSTFRIETKLRIYGRQQSRWPTVTNVTFYGYVSDIAEAYKPGSILVYPCLVPGGIKTKVPRGFRLSRSRDWQCADV